MERKLCNELKKTLYDLTMNKYAIAKNDRNEILGYKYIKKIYTNINSMKDYEQITAYLNKLKNDYSDLETYEKVILNSIFLLTDKLEKKYNINLISNKSNLSNNIYMSFDPFNNNNDLKQLCALYKGFSNIPLAPGFDVYNRFYSNLIKVNNINSGKYSNNYRDLFYSNMFNKWKNNIINMTQEEFLMLKSKGSLSDDFIKLREYLKHIGNVKTKEEVDRILLNKNISNDIQIAFKKYYYQEYNYKNDNYDHGWNHVISSYLELDKKEYLRTQRNIEHRLYINIDSIALHEFISLIVSKYDKYKIPYYFKYNEFSDRADKIVFYCSTNNINDHVKVINEVLNENPHIKKYIGKPNLFSGNVNEYIAYGSDPKNINGRVVSFNEIRSHASVDAISKTLREYINNNQNKNVIYRTKSTTLKDCIIRIITESLYNENTYMKMNNISIVELYNNIKNEPNLSYIFNNLYTQSNSDYTKGINIRINNYNTVIEQRKIETIISDSVVEYLIQNDKEFAHLLKINLKNEYNKYGINTDRLCFDNDKLANLNNFENKIIQKDNEYKIYLNEDKLCINKVSYLRELFKRNPSLLNDIKYQEYKIFYDHNGNEKSLNEILIIPNIISTPFALSIIKSKIYRGETLNNNIFYYSDYERSIALSNIDELMDKIKLPCSKEEFKYSYENHVNLDSEVKVKSKLIKWYHNINRSINNKNFNYILDNMKYTFMLDVMELEKNNAIMGGTYYNLYNELNNINKNKSLGGKLSG